MNITANGTYSFNVKGTVDYRIDGSLDGATVEFQVETENGSIAIPEGSFTEPTTGVLVTAGPVSAEVSGGGGSINFEIVMLEVR